MTNAWIRGVLCFAFAIVSFTAAQVRTLDPLLAIGLFIFAWTPWTMSPGTIWNSVAIAVFVLSLIPTHPSAPLRPRHAA